MFRKYPCSLILLVLFAGVRTSFGADLADLDQVGIRTAIHSETGQVRFIGTTPEAAISLPSTHFSPADAARGFVNEYGPLFGLTNPADELQLTKQSPRDQNGFSVRFKQVYQGVPIVAGDMIVNLDGNNKLLSMNGEVSPGLRISTQPSIAADQALTIALAAVAKWYQVDSSALEADTPVLAIYDPRLLKHSVIRPSLVWQLEVRGKEPLPIREFILVDAISGAINLHFNQIDTSKKLSTYTSGGTAALPGTFLCNETDLNCTAAGSDTDAKNAHLFASDTYDFYFTTHSRDGINGLGGTIISSVHFNDGVTCPNAFWDGTQMVYCDGLVADDVVGHELTHGVTQNTSNLFYYYQSGAINESFSDVWGEFIDLTNGRGTDTPAVRWQIGEDALGIGGTIRNMQDPTLFNDPDKMTSPFYSTSALDNGGVHTNSGINNKAAYLMTDGGTFNGRTVTSLGFTKVAKIYYEVQTHLLTSGSDYADLNNYLFQACQNLIGTAGITSGDCVQVQNATAAVEMDQQPIAGFNPDAALCPAGQQVASTVFFDNMEASTNWSFATLSGTLNNWRNITGYATSGTHSITVDDIASISDSVAYTTNAIALPTGAYLHFRHAFGFDSVPPTFYDGGVVEYSTNGSTWNDLGSLFVQGQGYGGTLQNAFSNPLGGRSAFVDESHGYVSSRYNLSSLAGQNARIRFRQGTDNSFGGPLGWVVDDVRIYTCGTSGGNTHTKSDFNGDGKDDLAGLTGTDQIFYSTNLSSWTNILGRLHQLVAGDFNGDGKADLAGLASDGHIYYSTNLSSWTNIPGLLKQLVVGDFNGDGKDDLAGLANNGQVFYSTNLTSWINIPGILTQLRAGDFNGDGKADLAGLASNGQVFYSTNRTSWTNIPGILAQLRTGDFNGDGKDDLAGLTGNGQVFYSTNLTSWINIPGLLNQLAVGDLNGDGKDDLAGLASNGQVFYSTNRTSWTNIPGILAQLRTGDFNGDGKADLAGLAGNGQVFYSTNLTSWINIPGILATLSDN